MVQKLKGKGGYQAACDKIGANTVIKQWCNPIEATSAALKFPSLISSGNGWWGRRGKNVVKVLRIKRGRQL